MVPVVPQNMNVYFSWPLRSRAHLLPEHTADRPREEIDRAANTLIERFTQRFDQVWTVVGDERGPLLAG